MESDSNIEALRAQVRSWLARNVPAGLGSPVFDKLEADLAGAMLSLPAAKGFESGAAPSDPRSYDRFKGQDYAPDRIHEQAVKFLRENRERPFFLYYPSLIPHVALHIPDTELEPYLAMKWNDPPFTRPKAGYTPHFTPRAAYAAMITRMDREIGRLMALISELGLDEAGFSECLASGQYTAAVQADLDQGIGLGINGTPAFFLNGNFISGAQPYSVFQQAIESLLAES